MARASKYAPAALAALPWPDNAPKLSALYVTLIAKSGRELHFACAVSDKRRLINGSSGPLWAVWPGEWTSHLFTVPRAQARRELGV